MSYYSFVTMDDADVPNPTTGKLRLYSSINHAYGNICSKDSAGNIIVYSPGITQEQVEDIVGGLLQSSSTVSVTYDDTGNALTMDVIAGGVNHNALLNFVANKHIDHSAVTVTGTDGLTGGGDLTASRTISLPAVGTAGSYGSATQVPVITTDAKGRVSNVTDTAITGVPAANITNTPAGNISSTTVQAAINELDSEKIAVTQKGAASGVCPLGSDSKVSSLYLPSYVDDVLEFANLATFPATGESGKIYVALDSNKTYRWSGTVYVEISASPVTTVFGRAGNVVATNGDYSASQITNVPSGNISSVTVQNALNELDTEKVATTRQVLAGTGLTGGGALSADVTLSLPAVGVAGSYGSATQVPVITTDAQGRVTTVTNTTIALTSGNLSDFAEAAQDAVGNILTNSGSISWAYNDALNTISASVLPAGVNHNALQNYVANEHVNHGSVSITAGTGLTGGGDLTATRTLSIPNSGVTATTYGSATQVGTFAVNALGIITSASNTAIAIPSTQITNFAEAVDDRVAVLMADGTGLTWTYNDPSNTLTGNVSLAPFSTTNLAEGTNLYYTDVRARAAVSATDSSSIDFTYTPATGVFTGSVLPAGVNHDALQNFVANEHIDHSSVSVTAGAGLTGGGTIAASRTISMPNVGTPSTYGDATSYPIITTDAQGRVTSVSTQAVPGGLVTAKTTAAVTNSSNVTNVALNELSITLAADTTYEINVILIFRSANTNTGISMAYGAGAAVISSIVGHNETSTSTTATNRLNFVSATTNTTFTSSAVINQNQIMNARIMLTTGGTGGTFIPQFRSENNGTTITVQPDSRITAEVI